MPLSDTLRNNNQRLWELMVTHPFVRELGEGTLPRAKFQVYFQQDCLFLKDLVAPLCAAISRAPDYHAARALTDYLRLTLGGEEVLFQEAFRQMGLSKDDVKALKHLPTALAYSHFLRTLAYEGSFEEFLAALLCIEWTYADWAQRLVQAGKRPKDLLYQRWIEIHAGKELADFVSWMRRTLDSAVVKHEVRLKEVFHTALRYEYMFWEMAYRGEKWPD